MTRKLIKRLNQEAKRRKHQPSAVKVFNMSQLNLRVVKEGRS